MYCKFIILLKKLKKYCNIVKYWQYKVSVKKINDLTLHLYLNSNCNSKCKFCNLWKTEPKVIPEEVLYNYLKPLYEKTEALIPTSGEYTISQSNYNYLNWLMENYPQINLCTETNGIAFNEKWQQFSIKHLVRTACSLNAINAKRYQETVWEGEGGEEVYNKIINNLKNYQKLLKEKHMEAYSTRLSMVLTLQNYCDIPEFVRLSLELNSPFVVFFFDANNYNIIHSEHKQDAEQALITLLELEKLLKGHYLIFFKLYTPFSQEYINSLELKLSLEELKAKYSQIWELAKNKNIKKDFEQRSKLRKRFNKKYLSFSHEMTLSGSQFILNNKKVDYCTLPWKHIKLNADGYLDFCSWHLSTQINSPSIYEFVNNGKLNVEKMLNSTFYKFERRNMKKKCYAGCMANCPYKNDKLIQYYKNLINN